MDPLLKQELRGGWLGVGEAYQPLDFLGMALGAYFIFSGVSDRAPRWLTIGLGGVMIYIHSRRFFYAPKTREGLIRLLRDLDVTPQELTGAL